MQSHLTSNPLLSTLKSLTLKGGATQTKTACAVFKNKEGNQSGFGIVPETISDIWGEWRRQKLPLYLFLLLCFNLVVAPAVFAAGGETLSRTQSYALGLLGIVTVALSIYLFVVMFQPERF
ncbi:K+-transporting ATPase, F subunit [Microseira wollei NIES-4236]|uniref:K+-transporting ATPase, F subunit n=2 Tax=Microseira wollei TaxID=467598 RepID=A0AAV3X426_9CYAN|nr:K+-transporting ATPase, F subunit [Microseira wollei NIES-4236]